SHGEDSDQRGQGAAVVGAPGATTAGEKDCDPRRPHGGGVLGRVGAGAGSAWEGENGACLFAGCGRPGGERGGPDRCPGGWAGSRSGSTIVLFDGDHPVFDEGSVPMNLQMDCSVCRRKMQFPEALLGKGIRCPHCNTVQTASVPASTGQIPAS